jgi:excisionase family DNA binding protein
MEGPTMLRNRLGANGAITAGPTDKPTPAWLEPLLFTSRQAAARLNVSERTLFDLAADGQVRALRIGKGKKKLVRYDPRDLQAFIDRLRESTAAPNQTGK